MVGAVRSIDRICSPESRSDRAWGLSEPERERRAHLDRLLSLALQPERHRGIEEHRIPVAVDMNEFWHQLSAKPVALAACPVHVKPGLVAFRFQRQNSADGPPAGAVKDMGGNVVRKHIERGKNEPRGAVRVSARAPAAHRAR